MSAPANTHRAYRDYLCIDEAIYGVMATNAVSAGIRLGLFEEMAKRPSTLEELAACGAGGAPIFIRPLKMLLTVYEAMHLVEVNQSHFYLIQEARQLLLKSSPLFMGDIISKMDNLWKEGRRGNRDALLAIIRTTKTLSPFEQLILAVSSTAAMILAHREEIFHCLASKPCTVRNISFVFGLTEEDAAVLLGLLEQRGLIERDVSERFLIAHGLKPYLVPGDDCYHGPVFDMIGGAWNTTQVSDLLAAIESDAPIVPEGKTLWVKLSGDNEANVLFQKIMYCLSWPAGYAIADAVDFSMIERILDLSDEAAGILIPILKSHPTIKGIVPTLSATKLLPEKAKRHGVLNRISTTAAEVFRNETATAEVVILNQVLCNYDEQSNRGLLIQTRNFLQYQGRLLIHERLLHDSGGKNLLVSLQNLFALMWTRGHQHKEKEVYSLLEETGFHVMGRISTAGGFSVIEAIKENMEV